MHYRGHRTVRNLQSKADNYGIEIEVTNYYQLIGGIALILFGSLVFWSIWIFSQLVFSTICDIKLIRNKLYGLNNDNLQSFMDEDDDDDEDENAKEGKDNKANKKKSLLQKLRDL